MRLTQVRSETAKPAGKGPPAETGVEVDVGVVVGDEAGVVVEVLVVVVVSVLAGCDDEHPATISAAMASLIEIFGTSYFRAGRLRRDFTPPTTARTAV